MARKISVLVIEDDDDLRQSIRSNLDSDEFEVCVAANGLAGIKAVCTHAPRLILLDVTENPEQVVSELKLDPDTKHIPIIVLTEGDSVEGQKLASKMCVDDYITKPFIESSIAGIVRLKLEKCESNIKRRQHQKKIPVLVIDDEADIRRLVELNLRIDGFDVCTTSDGPSGIEAARKHKPKLILLDVMMPGMDGLEVLTNLKWNKKTKSIPVFMLTSKSTTGDMDHAFSRRADAYITKPFDGETLGRTIKKKLKELKK